MLATSTLVRRSVLLIPLLDADAVQSCWRHEADAVAFDLGGTLVSAHEAIAIASKGGAEVFVCLEGTRAYAQVKATAGAAGLTGVVLPNAESAADIDALDEILRERERDEGLPIGTLEIMPLLGTARGVWNARDVVNASLRVRCAAIDEPSLCRSLAILPSDDFDPLSFA